MGRSPLADALIALGVSAGVLFGATWVLRTLNSDIDDPAGGINAVACTVVHQVSGWTPSFPCVWLFAAAFVVIWGLVYGTVRR